MILLSLRRRIVVIITLIIIRIIIRITLRWFVDSLTPTIKKLNITQAIDHLFEGMHIE